MFLNLLKYSSLMFLIDDATVALYNSEPVIYRIPLAIILISFFLATT